MQGLSLGTMLSNFLGVPHKSSLLAEASFHGFPARRIPMMQQVQPRSQSSSAISDVTSPVKLVGKIRLGLFALSE